MFSLTSSQVIFQGKLASTSHKLLRQQNFQAVTFLLPIFSVRSKQNFQMANLLLATVNFETETDRLAARQSVPIHLGPVVQN